MMAQPPTSFEWPGDSAGGVPAGSYPILGHGLWGPTLDLGDGTLLKLVCGHAGIGDGRDIHANEVRVLSLIGCGRLGHLAVPRLIAHGSLAPRTQAAAPGYVAWIRLTRVAGLPIGEDWLAGRSAPERKRFAESFGSTVASLRGTVNHLAARRPLALDDRLRALLTALPAASARAEDRELCGNLLGAVDALPESRRRGFVHGDMHLQNLLVDDSGCVCSIIDFGESGRGFREIDLAYLHWLPDIEKEALRAYRNAAGPIDEPSYRLAGAIYALTSAVLAERRGDAREAAAERRRLAGCIGLSGLGGYAIPADL